MLKSILFLVLFASVSYAGPLHQAIWRGDIELLRKLIRDSANLVEADSEGNTPLHIAAELNRRDIFELILRSGGQPVVQILGMQNSRGERVLQVATRTRAWDIVAFLYQQGLELTPGMSARFADLGWADRVSIAARLGKQTLGDAEDLIGVSLQSWPIPVQHETSLVQRLDAHSGWAGIVYGENYELPPEQLRFFEILDFDLSALIQSLEHPVPNQTPWPWIFHRILRGIYDQFVLMPTQFEQREYLENSVVRRLRQRLIGYSQRFSERHYAHQHLMLSARPFPLSVVRTMANLVDGMLRNGTAVDVNALRQVQQVIGRQYRFYRTLVPLEYVLQSVQNLALRSSLETLTAVEREIILSELRHIGFHVGGIRERVPGVEHGMRRFSAGQLKAIKDAAIENAQKGNFDLLRQGFYATIPLEFFTRLGRMLHNVQEQAGQLLSGADLIALIHRISRLVDPLKRLIQFEITPTLQTLGVPDDQFNWGDAVWKKSDLETIMKIIKTLKSLESMDASVPRDRQIYALVRLLEILGESDKNISFGLKSKYGVRWTEVFRRPKDIRDFFSHLEQGNNLRRWRTFEASPEMAEVLSQFRKQGLSNFMEFFRALYTALLRDLELPELSVEHQFIRNMADPLVPRITAEDRKRLKQTVPELNRMAIAIIWQIEANRLSLSLEELLAWADSVPLSKESKRTLRRHLSKLAKQKLSKEEQDEGIRVLESAEAQDDIWALGHGAKFAHSIDNMIAGFASPDLMPETALRQARELGVTNLTLWEDLYSDLHQSECRSVTQSSGEELEMVESIRAIGVAKKILDELTLLESVLPDEFKRLAQEKPYTKANLNRLREILESDGPAWLASEHLISSFRAFAQKLARYLNDWSGGLGAPSERLNDHFEQFAAELGCIEHFAKSYLHIHDVTEITKPAQRLIFIILRLLYGDILLGQGWTQGVLLPYQIKPIKTYLKQFVHATTDVVRKVEENVVEENVPAPDYSRPSSVPATAASASTATQVQQIPDYWYNEDDLQQALLLRLQGAYVDINSPTLRVLPAIGGTNLGQQIEMMLRDELARDRTTPRTILLPYNIDNRHWIGIVVHFGPQVVIEILDSFGSREEIPAYVWRELRAVFPNATITVPRVLEQNDGYNCGPLTVENLARAGLRALGVLTEDHSREPAGVRDQQLELLRFAGHATERLIVPVVTRSPGPSRVTGAQAFFKK